MTAAACHTGRTPELRVLGVQSPVATAETTPARPEVVIMQVTNPASRPMQLTRLDYVFASSTGETVGEGTLDLSREVPAGAAIVMEVPLDIPSDTPGDETVTLKGRLTAVSDEIVKTFRVSAEVHAPK